MSKLYNAGSIITDYNDNGHMATVVKPYGLKLWAMEMENSNNQHDDQLLHLSHAVEQFNKKIADLENLMTYVANNYPFVMEEYIVATKSKARMEVPNE